jgi:hypothetical protein
MRLVPPGVADQFHLRYRAVFDALDRAFRTASWLHEEVELEFVVAPLRDDDGIVTRRLGDRYAVTMSPFIVGESSQRSSTSSAENMTEPKTPPSPWKVLSENLSG